MPSVLLVCHFQSVFFLLLFFWSCFGNAALVFLVKSWGTEGRVEGEQIPASNNLHDCVNFRGEDIKDLHVHEVFHWLVCMLPLSYEL